MGRYIRNTLSDTAVHAEHQLRVDRSTWPVEKNIYINLAKLGRMKELGRITCVSRTGPTLGDWGNWSRGPIPTSGQSSESEEKHLQLRVKQLIYGSLNGMRIRQSLMQPYIPWTGMLVPWKAQQLEAGVRSCEEQPRVKAAADCGERDWGDVREEIMVGNASGGKPVSHDSKEILLGHAYGVEPSP